MKQQTKHYEMFKIYPGNRPIDRANLESLITSISERNLLEERPILINEFNEILDGQHRLEAAKILNIPVHYIISGECLERKAYDHIMAANINQRKWTIDDFLNLYSYRDNNEQYKEFISLEITDA